jgi:hypothetical protein
MLKLFGRKKNPLPGGRGDSGRRPPSSPCPDSPHPGAGSAGLGRARRRRRGPGPCGPGVPGHHGAGLRAVAVQLRCVLAHDRCAPGPA